MTSPDDPYAPPPNQPNHEQETRAMPPVDSTQPWGNAGNPYGTPPLGQEGRNPWQDRAYGQAPYATGNAMPPAQYGPYPGGIYAPTRTAQGLSIAALVCGILGLFCFVTSIPAIICGIIGLQRANKENDGSAKVMSIVGIVLGALVVIGIVGFVAIAWSSGS